jgi:hypothetical protein
MIDVFNGKVELVFVALDAAKFGAAIDQHPRQSDAMTVIKRHQPVIEDLGGGDRGLAINRRQADRVFTSAAWLARAADRAWLCLSRTELF